MLIFAHLLIGAIAGLFIARMTKEPGMVIFASAASFLPGLIDKPKEVLGAAAPWYYGRLDARDAKEKEPAGSFAGSG